VRWSAALLPLAVGGVFAVLTRTGVLTEHRLRLALTALRADWELAAGTLLSGLLCALLAVATRRDAVWRRRLAARSAAAAEDRRRLLSRLDHELKNPLTAMRAAIANVIATADDDGAADGAAGRDGALRSLEEQVLRLARLTADLRKITDVETRPPDRSPVDLTELLEDAVDALRERPGAVERVVTLDLPHAPWPLPPVRGDADLLSLAVTNLLDNALKYTGPGGRIEVRAREAGGSVVVEVADTGQGIDPADLPHVWEELYRSPAARSVPGSGLGLPLVRAVVEHAGGEVTITSRPGSGTAVRLRLPAAAPAVAQPAV
jgi:two-component system OmpR family sensor kinase